MRKIEFKAKDEARDIWKISEDPTFKQFIVMKEPLVYSVNFNTLCQLITEINGVKIFEYDCWYFTNGILYFYYDDFGVLSYKHYLHTDNIFMSYSSGVNDLREYLKYVIDNYTFIGNWHDGEQFLLDKIKEVNMK